MTWTFDKEESRYSAVFPKSKVRIHVEGDEFSAADQDGAFLPLIEGRYYHFIIEDKANGAKLSAKSSFVRKAARHGSIAPGTAVGYGRLYLEGFETPELSLGVEVASEVVSYKKDYQDLLRQLTEDIADLQMQCSSCVQGLVKVDPHAAAKNDIQRFFFLLGLVGSSDFDLAVRQIVERPQTQLVEVESEMDVRRMARFGRAELRQIASNPRRMALPDHLRGRYPGLKDIPERIITTRRVESVDTPENRFIKYALNFFLDRLRSFRRILAERGKIGTAMAVEVDLDVAVRMLTRWTGHEFFKQVGPLLNMPTGSVVLQRREGYREVLKKWLQFQAGTQLVWKNGEDVYAANQRKMSALYEYWCFFRLLKIVGKLFAVKTEEVAAKMIGKGADGLSLKLKEGCAITLDGTFDSGRQGARYRRLAVEFCYNRTFSAKGKAMSWTLPMRPDYTLAFRPMGLDPEEAAENDLITYVHFDAKYKAKDLASSLSQIGKDEDADADEGIAAEDTQLKRDVKRVDILKMHTYRDAIRKTGGAYVLYPGTEVKIDRESGEILPGLGAFTMSPSNDSSEKIMGFLSGVAKHLCDRITRWENYTYRAFQIYSQDKQAWDRQRDRTQDLLVEGDESELKKGLRQNLAENAAARFADPDRYYSHKPTERYGEIKWAYFNNLCLVRKRDWLAAKKPDPEKIVMISVNWEPPVNLIVQRFVGEYQGILAKSLKPDFPGKVYDDEDYLVWDVRVIDPEGLEKYMRSRGDL